MSQRSLSGLTGDETDEHGGFPGGLDITAPPSSETGKRVRVWRLVLSLIHFKIALKNRRVDLSPRSRAEHFPPESVEDREEIRGADDEGDTLSATFEICATASSAAGKSFWSSNSHLRLLFICRLVVATRNNKSRHVIDVASDDEQGQPGRDEGRLRRIVKDKDLDSLREFGGVEGVSSFLDSIYCSTDWSSWRNDNIIPRQGYGHFLFKSMNSFTIYFLLIAAGLSFPIDMMEEGGAKYGWHDGVSIFVAVIVLIASSSVKNFYQQIKMEKKMLEDEDEMLVDMERRGKSGRVSISDVMVGDRVELGEGDIVPADGLFLRGQDLTIDDVLNPEIDCEKNPFLLAGSKITKGRCSMIVVSVGADTALGDKVSQVISHPTEKPLLQTLLDKPHVFTDRASLLVAVLIAVVVLVRLLFRKHGSHFDMPEIKGETTFSQIVRIFGKLLLKPRGRVCILINVLAVVEIGIQHGMHLVVTISLSFWRERFISNHANPQNLSACCAIGLVSVICFDITGALFCNQIEVEEFWIGEKDLKVETQEIIDQDLRLILDDAELRCRNLSSTNNGGRTTEDGEHNFNLHCKGSASTVLEKCSHYYDTKGEVQAMEEDQKSKFEQVIKAMEINGLRPIVFARHVREDNMHLLALVGLKYVCQEEIKNTLKDIRDAGLRVILVSEDELGQAKAIASELGLVQRMSCRVAMEGAEIEKLGNAAMAAKLTVMGNALPKHKLLLVQKLQEQGEVVMFIGGMSVGDVPALKTSDVGIVVEDKSVEIAKMASDIILKSVESLSPVRTFGQIVCANIQTFYRLHLTAVFSWLSIAVFSTISSGESPMTAIHIIWVNLILSVLGCLMMAMELKGNKTRVSQQGKRNPQLVTTPFLSKIAIWVLYQASVALLIEHLGKHVSGVNDEVRRAVVLNFFTLCQIFNLLDAMEITKGEVFTVVLSNYWFILALGAVLVIQALLLPYTERFSGLARLSADKWAFCFFFAALPWRPQWLVYMFSFIRSILFPWIWADRAHA